MKNNWYVYLKLIKSEYLGEYWIDSGSAIFADGNVGDMNHEGYVIQHAQSLLCESDDWESGKQELAEEIWGLVENNPVLLEAAISYGISEKTCEEDAEQIICEFGEKSGAMNPEKWLLFTVANDNYSHPNMDLRDFAMKNWGWKAVRGRNVQTWFLTSSDLSSISDGLNEILGYEEEAEKQLFNLEIRSNGKYFSDIPLEIIETKNPAAIQTFRQVAFG